MREEAIKLLNKAIDITEQTPYHCNISFSLHIGAFSVAIYPKTEDRGILDAIYHSDTVWFNGATAGGLFTSLTQVHATLDAILAGTFVPEATP